MEFTEFTSKPIDLQARVFLIQGKEAHLKRLAADRIICGLLPAQERAHSLESLLGSEQEVTAERILGLAQTAPFFSACRVVLVEEAGGLKAEPDQKRLAEAAPGLPEFARLILVTGEKEAAASLRKAVERDGMVVNCSQLKLENARDWAIAQASSQGKQMDRSAAARLVELAGRDLSMIAPEVDKLVQFVGERDRIGNTDIEAVTPRSVEDVIFGLTDAVGQRKRNLAVQTLRGLLRDRSEPPERIVYMLARQFRQIWQIKLLLEAGWRPGKEKELSPQVISVLPRESSVLALPPSRSWQLRKLTEQARSFNWPQLEAALVRLQECDLAIKEIGPAVYRPEVAVELAVIELSGAR